MALWKTLVIVFGSLMTLYLVVITLTNIPDGSGLQKTSGIIVDISESGGPYDVCFRFKDDHREFYINRGLQFGLNLDSLKARAMNRQASFYFYNRILNVGIYPVRKMEVGEAIIYDSQKISMP